MRHLGTMRNQVERWQALKQQAGDLSELMGLAQDDDAMRDEIAAETEKLVRQLDQLELTLVVDRAVRRTATQFWRCTPVPAAWMPRTGRKCSCACTCAGRRTPVSRRTILDVAEGEEAGIKSVTIEIRGANAYGYARGEAGTHRLVRLSPFDAAHRRHTAFALVEVLPEVEDNEEIKINDDDLRVDTYRSSGAGGQHVNKTSSAVRITHLPTGIVVTCQNERSQLQNRESAMKILRARLTERAFREREEEQSKLKGEHIAAGWGNRIRSYVLHPYTMVTDHRTEYSTGNIQAVLSGELDPFIEAYLHQQLGEENAQ